MGYKAVGFSAILICAAAQQIKRVLSDIYCKGGVDLPRRNDEVEEGSGRPDRPGRYYRIERETVER